MDIPDDSIKVSAHRNLLQNLLTSPERTDSTLQDYYAARSAEQYHQSLEDCWTQDGNGSRKRGAADNFQNIGKVKKRRTSLDTISPPSVTVTVTPSKSKRISLRGDGNEGASVGAGQSLNLLAAAANFLA
jgi:hypothetical protein